MRFLTVQMTTAYKAVGCSAHQKTDCPCFSFRLWVCIQTSFFPSNPQPLLSSSRQHRVRSPRTQLWQRAHCLGFQCCGLPYNFGTQTWWASDWHLWASETAIRFCAFYKETHTCEQFCAFYGPLPLLIHGNINCCCVFSDVPNKPILEHSTVKIYLELKCNFKFLITDIKANTDE